MSLRRTPPASPAIQHSESDPFISAPLVDDDLSKSSLRNAKRRRNETDGANVDTSFEATFAAWSKTQNLKLTEILETVTELKKQNAELRTSCEFNATQYEAILKEFKQMQEDRKSHMKYIEVLENKVEILERNSRAACFEIHNVPSNKTETKYDLIKVALKTSNVLKSTIEQTEIRNIFRGKSKSPDKRPIIVELNSVLSKDRIVKATKKFNQDNKTSKLNSKHLGLDGPQKPIFICENLTPKARRLFYRARELQRSQDYMFCWTNYGNVFLRKAEGSPAILIESETQIDNLLKK